MSTWYDNAVFYHMYPLGMSGAPFENREESVTHRFEELERWLPHIKELGCTAIYIGPLFESTTHGYDTRDYKMVDRRLGDNDDFIRFVKEAHKLGIRVVVDGVFNHTGREFFAFRDIQQNREGSRYCGWYKGLNFGWNNPYNDGFGYEAWRNCFELVNLNLQNQEVRDYLFDVIRFWIDTFDIDGIRLDCADCLDFEFMKQMRRMTEGAKKDFWLMGEVIHGDYARWVKPEYLHSVTNYELWKGLYSGHNDHNYFEIAHTIRRQFDANGGIYRGCRLYSFVDNHDVDRIVNTLKEKKFLRSVYTLLYTLPGIPSVYYGSEFGVEGKKEWGGDQHLRPALDLEKLSAEPPVPELPELIRRLARVHAEERALTDGAYRELLLTNRQYAFARILGDEAVIAAVNNDDTEARFEIPCPVPGTEAVEVFTEKALKTENGKIIWEMPAYGSAIFIVKQG